MTRFAEKPSVTSCLRAHYHWIYEDRRDHNQPPFTTPWTNY